MYHRGRRTSSAGNHGYIIRVQQTTVSSPSSYALRPLHTCPSASSTGKTTEAVASCKLKLVDPAATPIHLPHEYLARSNNNHRKGMEIFVAGNLLLHSAAQNVRLKLLADTPRFLIVALFSIDPIVDRT